MRNRAAFFTTVLCAATLGRAWAQAPQFAALNIAFANGVAYVDDTSDYAKFVTSPNPVNPTLKNMQAFVALADIVSVNGKSRATLSCVVE
jgi:hypothetical protein